MFKKTAGVTVLVLAMALFGRTGSAPDAVAAQATNQGMRIATVDLARLFGALDEMKLVEVKLETLNRELIDDRSAVLPITD